MPYALAYQNYLLVGVRNLTMDNFGYDYRNNNFQELNMKELEAKGK
jgi:hypothetical protein